MPRSRTDRPTSKPPSSQRSRRKGNKRERTRTRLVEAAAAVIGEKGLERAALEDIATRAGMSRGAIYGNFRDKEELFLAVAEQYWRPILPPPPGAGGTLRGRMRALGEAVAGAAAQRSRFAVGATSFVLYALQHDAMRSVVVRKNAELYRLAADGLTRAVPETDLPMPAERFVRVVHALTEGLFALHALTPELVTRDVIVSAFEALA